MTSTPFADAAVGYAERGWRVFKIPPGRKVPVDRWVNGDGSEVATSEAYEIRERAAKYPDHNIGIATGKGLAVLDVDPQHGGIVPDWAPPTLVAKTPSGGVHLYYEVDGHVPNSAGKLAQGVDVRGDGGMVLAPPSWTGSGKTHDYGCYEWAKPVGAGVPYGRIARIAASLLTPSERVGEPSAKLAARTFGEGERHQAMLTLAGKMRSIGCEFLEIAAALDALNRSRFEPPLEYQWVEKVARSIMQYPPDSALLP